MSARGIGVPAQGRLLPVLLDRFEQVLVCALYVLLTYRVLHSDNPFRYLLFASESAVVVFVLIRRPTQAVSVVFGDWLLAATATAATMLIAPVPDHVPALAPLGLLLFVVGALFQVSAKLALNRSFGIAPANRGIKRSGPYRYVRHPMYAGYFVNNIGLLLLMLSFANAAVYAIAWTAQVMRVLAEERLLSQDPAYRAYMEDVRWRVIPGIF